MLDFIFYLLIYPLILLTSISFGRYIAQRVLKGKKQWKPVGLENGLMGFYALLTSFTLVQSAYVANDRNMMIHTIADDMSEILRISKTNGTYLQNRMYTYFSDFYRIIKNPIIQKQKFITSRIREIDSLDDSLDANLAKYIVSNTTAEDKVSILLSKTDRMESTYYRLMHSYNKSVPKVILFILILFSMFIGFLIGFIEKINHNSIHIISLTFVVMSFIILYVIHDLNNPSIGFLKPDFQSIAEVIKSFHLPG